MSSGASVVPSLLPRISWSSQRGQGVNHVRRSSQGIAVPHGAPYWPWAGRIGRITAPRTSSTSPEVFQRPFAAFVSMVQPSAGIAEEEPLTRMASCAA